MKLVKTPMLDRRDRLNALSAISQAIKDIHEIMVHTEMKFDTFVEDGKTFAVTDHDVVVAREEQAVLDASVILQLSPETFEPILLAHPLFEESENIIINFIANVFEDGEILPEDILQRAADHDFIKNITALSTQVRQESSMDDIPTSLIQTLIAEVAMVRLLDETSDLIHNQKRVLTRIHEVHAAFIKDTHREDIEEVTSDLMN